MATFKTSDVTRELPAEEFTVECNSGNVYSMRHPKLVSGLELTYMSFSDVAGALQSVLGDDYEEFIREDEIDGFALDQIFEGYLEHYGIPVSPGNGRGPRKPSPGTAKRSKRTSRTTTPRKTP